MIIHVHIGLPKNNPNHKYINLIKTYIVKVIILKIYKLLNTF